MPLDPNISLYANAPPGGQQGFANPDSINKLIGTATSIKDFQAKQAIGEAYKQATDAQTGDTDYNKLTGLITQNPQAAWGAPDAITKARAQVNQYLVGKNLSADAWRNQIDILGRALDPLLADADVMSGKKGVDPGAAIDAAARVANLPNSPFSNADILKFVQGMPKDPMQVRQRLMQLHTERLTADQAHSALFGAPQMTNTGETIQPQAISPVTGVRNLAPGIPVTTTPAEKMQGTQGVVPDGSGGFVPTNIPNDARFSNTGRPRAAVPAPAPVTGGAASPAAPPAPRAALAPPGGIPGALATAPALGQGTGIEGGAALSTKLWGEASSAANNYKSRVFPLEQAIPKLEKLGPTGTGPSSEEVNNIKSFLQTVGVISPSQTVANFDEAKKYLTQYASGQAGAMGQGTDQKLATALTANPNTSISNLASTDLAKAALALERMRQAQITAFRQTKQTADKFADFSTEWNTAADPRAYMLDQVSPQRRKEIIDSIKDPDQRKRFLGQAWNAMQSGLMPKDAFGGANASK